MADYLMSSMTIVLNYYLCAAQCMSTPAKRGQLIGIGKTVIHARLSAQRKTPFF